MKTSNCNASKPDDVKDVPVRALSYDVVSLGEVNLRSRNRENKFSGTNTLSWQIEDLKSFHLPQRELLSIWSHNTSNDRFKILKKKCDGYNWNSWTNDCHILSEWLLTSSNASDSLARMSSGSFERSGTTLRNWSWSANRWTPVLTIT